MPTNTNRRRPQFSLRTALLIMFLAAPASIFLAKWWQGPRSPYVKVYAYGDGTFEACSIRGPLKEISPVLRREVKRREHFEGGAVLLIGSDLDTPYESTVKLIRTVRDLKVGTIKFDHGNAPGGGS